MEQFVVYFKRADLDGDGRISGAEAVSFFQGSNLPKNVLAQIWSISDQRQTGFLGRAEFYNALKLVTVAQSKRELTPEIVKAALYGPAAAKIPPPKINLPATPAPGPYPTPSAMAPSAQMGQRAPAPSHSVGFRGEAPNQIQGQFFPQQNQPLRPPQPMPLGTSVRPSQATAAPEFPRGGNMVGPSFSNTNASSDWVGGGRSVGGLTGAGGINSAVFTPSKPQPPVAFPSQTVVASDTKALVISGNGPASGSAFGSDLFSASPPPPKQDHSVIAPSSNVLALPSTTPVSGGQQASEKPNPLDSLTSFLRGPSSGPTQRPPTSLGPSQQVPSQASPSFAASGVSTATGNSTANSSTIPWPKMKPADVQKYSKVFLEVDTDRDGRITGEQARDLFLSWRLPRDILKQVWDLSDQDSDSMLSLREFCFALYLMERFREGRTLPTSLPSNIMYDETPLSMTGPPKVAYGGAAWGPSPGFGPQQGMPGARPMGPATGLKPGTPVPPANDAVHSNQRDLSMPVLGDSFANQTDGGDQNSAKSNLQEAANEKKVEKIILDSREKIEFYRSKMQDLVLYKSRCDNKLNEITERALADKRESEMLGKKYEEKYKQVAEIASKLTIEEATFREIQERKTELHQAIVKIEQGGSSDGILQVRADRIQSDLDELMKALLERCKKHGVDVKPTALLVLPAGWQPGIPEVASIWDEDWDKFEDEGFVNELALEGKTKSTSDQKEAAFTDDGFLSESVSNAADEKQPDLFNTEHAFDDESIYNHSEDGSARSPRGSPFGRTTSESPTQIFSDPHFETSEGEAETHRSFDDSNWGFDTNDDVNSVWRFNTKDSDSFENEDTYSVGTSDFGVNPIKTGSSLTDAFQSTRSPFFEDSVPASPASKFGNNSPRYSEAGDNYFDNFSRFDSFRTNDGGGFFSQQQQQPDKLTRFDSISSTKDFGGHSRGFSSFDDSDPFGSSGPFKVSSENPSPKKSDSWSSF